MKTNADNSVHSGAIVRRRLCKKQTALCVLNMVRDWQCAGMPTGGSGCLPDSDEAWDIVRHLQRRIARYSLNTVRTGKDSK
jgi:hypothetical protein